MLDIKCFSSFAFTIYFATICEPSSKIISPRNTELHIARPAHGSRMPGIRSPHSITLWLAAMAVFLLFAGCVLSTVVYLVWSAATGGP